MIRYRTVRSGQRKPCTRGLWRRDQRLSSPFSRPLSSNSPIGPFPKPAVFLAPAFPSILSPEDRIDAAFTVTGKRSGRPAIRPIETHRPGATVSRPSRAGGRSRVRPKYRAASAMQAPRSRTARSCSRVPHGPRRLRRRLLIRDCQITQRGDASRRIVAEKARQHGRIGGIARMKPRSGWQGP